MSQVYKRTKKIVKEKEESRKKKATYDFFVDQYYQCHQPQCHTSAIRFAPLTFHFWDGMSIHLL